MNLKKMIAVSAMLLLGAGLSYADEWTCAKVEQKVQRNEPLPVDVINADLTSCKTRLANILQEFLGELNKPAHQRKRQLSPYVLYSNAAIIYATEDEWSDWHAIYENSFANVKKYATKAIGLEGSRRSPNMHYVRAITVERYFNLDMAGNQGDQCLKDTVNQSVNEVKAMLRDFEEVGRRQPSMAPWFSMANYYEILGQRDNARRCRAKAREYAVKQQQETTNEVMSLLKKLFS